LPANQAIFACSSFNEIFQLLAAYAAAIHFCFIPKRVLIFDATATSNPPALQIAYQIHRHLLSSSTMLSFLQ
jgi:hypothetical protein